MIENYLKKLQELQRDTLSSGIYIDIENRYDSEENYPWLVITVKTAGWANDTDKGGYLTTHMYGNMYKDEAKNERHQAEVYAKVEAFVKSRLSTEADRARFMKAYERALEFQKACVFCKASVTIDCQFCESNLKEENIDAWSIKVYAHYKKAGADETTLRRAQWTAWDEDEKFYCELEDVEKTLIEEGIINHK